MAGYEGRQQRWILQRAAQKAEVAHSSIPRVCLLSFPLTLLQVIPLLTHVLVIEFLFPGLSPKFPSVIIVLLPRKCLYFPPTVFAVEQKDYCQPPLSTVS